MIVAFSMCQFNRKTNRQTNLPLSSITIANVPSDPRPAPFSWLDRAGSTCATHDHLLHTNNGDPLPSDPRPAPFSWLDRPRLPDKRWLGGSLWPRGAMMDPDSPDSPDTNNGPLLPSGPRPAPFSWLDRLRIANSSPPLVK